MGVVNSRKDCSGVDGDIGRKTLCLLLRGLRTSRLRVGRAGFGSFCFLPYQLAAGVLHTMSYTGTWIESMAASSLNARPAADAGWRVLFAFQRPCPRAAQAG